MLISEEVVAFKFYTFVEEIVELWKVAASWVSISKLLPLIVTSGILAST